MRLFLTTEDAVVEEERRVKSQVAADQVEFNAAQAEELQVPHREKAFKNASKNAMTQYLPTNDEYNFGAAGEQGFYMDEKDGATLLPLKFMREGKALYMGKDFTTGVRRIDNHADRRFKVNQYMRENETQKHMNIMQYMGGVLEGEFITEGAESVPFDILRATVQGFMDLSRGVNKLYNLAGLNNLYEVDDIKAIPDVRLTSWWQDMIAGFTEFGLGHAMGGAIPKVAKLPALSQEAFRDAFATFLGDPERGSVISSIRDFGWGKELLELTDPKATDNELAARLLTVGSDSVLITAGMVSAQKLAGVGMKAYRFVQENLAFLDQAYKGIGDSWIEKGRHAVFQGGTLALGLTGEVMDAGSKIAEWITDTAFGYIVQGATKEDYIKDATQLKGVTPEIAEETWTVALTAFAEAEKSW